MSLEKIRREIDDIDLQIVKLLSDRSRKVSEAGRLKKNEDGVRDPKRAGQMLEKVRAKAADVGLDQDIAEEIYRTIIGCFVRKELKEFSGSEAGKHATLKEASIRKAADQDCDQIVDIFNYYVEHGFAAYPEKPMDRRLYDFIKTIIHGEAFYVAETAEKKIVGFGFLKKYHPYPAFDRTAEAGYFILPEFTRAGLGGLLLETLEKEARAMGVDNLLVNRSSLNPPSREFHKKHGFLACGRFEKILTKFGQDIDIIWMQKRL
jgi:phosphinothricin acetyltransferase